MKIIVTGADGQLGKCLKDIQPNWIYLNRKQFDLADKNSILKALDLHKPNIIINCAAYTNVELAESQSELAHLINGHNLKYLCSTGAKIIHISTDYIFDGNKSSPYLVDDVPNPINDYGASKLLGERIISEFAKSYSIIRTSWVYSEYGKNFFKTIYGAAKTRSELQVVTDQKGAPTYARDLARFIQWKTLQNLWINKEILQFSAKNYCTWYDFALQIAQFSNPNCKVLPTDSSKFIQKAKRPANSCLHSNETRPDWRDSLKECVIRYKYLENKK